MKIRAMNVCRKCHTWIYADFIVKETHVNVPVFNGFISINPRQFFDVDIKGKFYGDLYCCNACAEDPEPVT